MITLEQFIEKYTGKKVEYHSFSSVALNQCVDIANQYIVDVLNLAPIIGTNAQDFPKKASNDYWNWIPNTPKGQPEKGDLMIFKSADGVGHISILVKNINLNLFTSFDQNYPTGSPCKLVNHNYTNVLGWLHPKQGSMQEKKYTEEEMSVVRLERDKNWNLYQEEKVLRQEAESELVGVRKQLLEEQSLRKDDLEAIASEIGSKAEVPSIVARVKTMLDFEDKATKLEKKLEEERNTYERKIKELSNTIESYLETVKRLQAELEVTKIEIEKLKQEKPQNEVVHESWITKLLDIIFNR